MLGAHGPRSTYRLQLRTGVDFERARRLVPVLADMGIHWLYLSPIAHAKDGSTHGYDVIDPTRIDPALGTEASLRALREELGRHGMGLLVDDVPNHMAQSLENPWWRDLLAQGPDGDAASVFDVDWSRGKVTIPVLSEPYGEALATGKLRAEPGALVYEGLRFPLAPGTEGETDADALHAKQHYRLIWWRLANHAINYRRFFDVNDLVCVRVEDEQVTARTHSLIDRLIESGIVDGVRIDHIDGLADPEGYLRRTPARTVYVEKILADGELLPEAWPVAGTTGYDFIAAAEDLFHDPRGLDAMRATWQRFTGVADPFEQIVRDAKRTVLDELFPAEVDALTDRIAARAAADLGGRDIPRAHLRHAIVESVVALTVYRTYGRAAIPGDSYAAEFVQDALAADDAARIRWEQLTGPAMAKGFEDCALYRYTVCVSRNEVGGHPGTQPISVEQFHRFAKRRAPTTMNAGSTHDTKRGEDVRARIAVLTEFPQEWEKALRRWHEANARHGEIDPSAEALLYQTLLGTWDGPPSKRYRVRIVDHMRKVVREARLHTSWTEPDDAYERAVERFVSRTLTGEHFTAELSRFAARIAWPGAVNSLAALVLRICSPGVPDVYNGTELWDLRLVDPDNRSPVDLRARERILREMPNAATALKHWQDGRIKMLTMRAAFGARPAGRYVPVAVTGTRKDNVVAFARRDGDRWVLAVVPRLIAGLVKPGRMPDWGRTALTLPKGAPQEWTNVITGEQVRARRVADLLGMFPVAVLTASGTRGRGSRRASAPR